VTAGRQVRNQHVDCGGKTPNGFLAFGDFQVSPHALLATVELHQDGVQSTGVRAGSTCAHIEASDRISCLWMFDLDTSALMSASIAQADGVATQCASSRIFTSFSISDTNYLSKFLKTPIRHAPSPRPQRFGLPGESRLMSLS